ncbi:MAG: thioredoxin domain-containing protein [Acidobacteria bacterium]|nr:thioredoxin domain-containing protein [Acidobacteriota bacterium]
MRKALLLVLSLLGLWDSAYLWWAYTTPSLPMVCLGDGCDAVRASPFAYPGGIPLPVFGVVMYATLVLLIFFEPLIGSRLARTARYAVAGISGAGFLFSLYLTGIEAFVLHAWCSWCVVSALAVTFIFALAVLDVLRPEPHPETVAGRALARRHLAVCAVAAAVGTPAFLLLSQQEVPPPAPPASATALEERLIRPDSRTIGNPRALVTVVEFGDFQCPACGMAEEAAREIRRKYASQVRFVFRQFPLEKIHSRALKAAEASECAAKQGKFWEAVEKLYGGDRDLSDAALLGHARELGLDLSRFEQCLAGGAMTARVRRDVEDGRALGVRATPTFFVGSQRIEGPIRLDQFEQLLALELSKSGARLVASNPPLAAPPQANPAPGQNPAQDPAGDPLLPSGGLLGGGGLFSQFQNPATTCSEEEALKEQPTLIRTSEAREFHEKGSAVLFVDVRQAREYETGRIPGAINLPVGEFEGRWETLPKDRSIVLYESGRSAGDVCASSRAAGRVLLAKGFARERVKVYQDGLAGWEGAGLPVVR